MRRHERGGFGLESGVAGAVRGGSGTAQVVVDAVAEVVGAAVRGLNRRGASCAPSLDALAEATARGSAKAAGEVCWTARGFLLGVLRFGGEEGEQGLDLARRASAAFIRGAHRSGSDIAECARGLAEAAVVWAGETGLDAARAASAAGQGALDEACELGTRFEQRVRAALRTGVAGAPVLVHEPARHHAGRHHP